MSIEAAIGRIDQILALQQQLADPAASSTSSTSSASGASSAAASGASGSGASTGGTTSFADMLAGAQQSGPAPTALPTADSTLSDPITSGVADPLGVPTTSSDGGAALSSAPAQVQAMTNEANSLLGKPYVWGGGHSGWGPQSGYDCSGFVSAVLHAGGYLSSPADTVSLPSQAGMVRGPGQYVTVYDRTGSGESGHVIIDINGQFYESGGSHGTWGGGGGVEKIARPSDAYLATFDTQLHPQGL